MEFRVLGPLEVWDGGRPFPIRGTRQRALLAMLLMRANEVVSSDRLLDELWGAEPPATGTKALQVRISQLRKALPRADVVETRSATPGEPPRPPAKRCLFGVDLPSTTLLRRRSSGATSGASKSCASSLSSCGSTRSWCSAGTASLSASSRRLSRNTPSGSVYGSSSCLCSIDRAARRRPSSGAFNPSGRRASRWYKPR